MRGGKGKKKERKEREKPKLVFLFQFINLVGFYIILLLGKLIDLNSIKLSEEKIAICQKKKETDVGTMSNSDFRFKH